MNKYTLMLILLASFVVSCSYERNTQVELNQWTLIKKVPAYRYGNDNTNYSFVWLVWANNHGEKYYERVEDFKAANYHIGDHVSNRDKR